ncbi:multiple sugar transport system permease protein [Aequitasia blattaphilus]|uniref:Carbohydrate ABC transporter permease n=1 Tax=Aequitasia blattaphilus TaxID=2949332 RepID=A0ABT1E7A8_9FIRM|nr:carbohydrate ABC transporter permease [Aequitasia blattaphilus]MCP1101499.1 carbohydrate ABC transporter permease [Aequitasia blattaphilus]MCR8614139.1 carbohydrate ABC transporter permease [Aequitasia blattaphilus]
MKKRKKKSPLGIFRWVLTGIVSFIILFPLYWVFISSITPKQDLFNAPIKYIPENPTLENYIRLFTQMKLGEKIKNTGIITFFALLVSTIICLMAAYAFTRYVSKGLKMAYGALVASALVPGIVTARPLYDLFKMFGLVDTFPGLVVLYTSALIPFTMIILGNFLGEIPVTLDEAAEVDGANMWQKLFLITLPLMKPAIATILIINFITCLNDLFTPLFFSQRIEVLSVAITTLPREMSYSMPWELVSTMGWIILCPIIIFVLFFEKQIMEGIMAGGVKQ